MTLSYQFERHSEMAELGMELCGLRMGSPIMLASGILGETGPSLARVYKAGAGAVVTKSIGSQPREGYLNPTVVEVEGGLLNAIGLSNPGVDAFLEELDITIKTSGKAPVIVSIFGADPQEFAGLAERMVERGASALELNLGCPHAKGYGAQIGQDPDLVKEITSAVKSTVHVPVLVKITPNVTDITEIALAVERGKGDAIVAINTVRAMAIDAELGRPVLSNVTGGLSGPAVKAIGLSAVWRIYEKVKIPIVGVGGISSGEDVVEYLMAGASAVQVGTVVWRGGPEVFGRMNMELGAFMDDHGHKAVKDMVGVAHRA
jgi:dihydroorotate dehydrogenase (NAD+) catalytic subunit